MLNFEFGRALEIFKTNVTTLSEADEVLKNLRMYFPSCRINFDLHDCDRILRVEGKACEINIDRILKIVADQRFEIELIKE